MMFHGNEIHRLKTCPTLVLNQTLVVANFSFLVGIYLVDVD